MRIFTPFSHAHFIFLARVRLICRCGVVESKTPDLTTCADRAMYLDVIGTGDMFSRPHLSFLVAHMPHQDSHTSVNRDGAR